MKNLSFEKHKYETQTELCLWRWKSIFRIEGNCNFRQVHLKFWLWLILKIGSTFTRRKVNELQIILIACVHFATTLVPMFVFFWKQCSSPRSRTLFGGCGKNPKYCSIPTRNFISLPSFSDYRPPRSARKGSSTESNQQNFKWNCVLGDKTLGSGPLLHKPTLNRLFAISPTVFVDSPEKLHCRMNWNIQFWENVANVDYQTEFVYLLQRMQYWIFSCTATLYPTPFFFVCPWSIYIY